MITGRPIKRTQGRVVPPAEPVNIAWQLTARGLATRQTKLTWETGLVVMFRLSGDVSSQNLDAIGPLLAQLHAGRG